jgi:excisionase family DNA binding protein
LTIAEQLDRRSRFLSVKEVAETLGFHPEAIREYARAGVIPAMRAGYRWKFDPRNFADWLRKRET